MRLIAIVGMPGSGKTEASKFLQELGFIRIRFGDITDEEAAKRGLELNEENEKKVREDLRKQHGMDAYAKLNEERIDNALKNNDVVIDGLYSMEEYEYLKKKYGDNLIIVALHAPPRIRHKRLSKRKIRPLSSLECKKRDDAETANLNKKGPIEKADYAIVNEKTINDLRSDLKKIIDSSEVLE